MAGTSQISSKTHNLAVAFVAIGAICTLGSPAMARDKPAPVRVMAVAMEPWAGRQSYVGVVRPRYESDLGFRVSGKITQRLVEIGDQVQVGTIIARLDATDARLREETQAAELRAAVSNRDQATASEARFHQLLAQGHASQANYDQRKSTADEAKERVERARRSLDLTRNELAYTELKADRTGVVTAIPVEVGQVVASGQTVARVASLDEREAVVAIPEHKLEGLAAARASVELWSGAERRYQASLREIAPEADRATRTYQARFTIDAADSAVGFGMTATVHLDPLANRPVARLPLSAVMSEGRGPQVWVVDEATGALKRTPVDVVAWGQDHAVVGGGLKTGDLVVTLGTHMLDENRTVRVVETRTEVGRLGSRTPLTTSATR